jgi:hypothetical protein
MLRTIAALVGLSLLVGCGRSEVGERLPDDPDQVILYSIHPDDRKLTPTEKGESMHGYLVLGKVEVTDPERRRAIIAAIKAAVRDKSVVQVKCFSPEHAVRVVKGSETIDLVICFHCHNYQGYRRGELTTTDGTPPISDSAQSLLDQTLREAGVPLVTPAKKD